MSRIPPRPLVVCLAFALACSSEDEPPAQTTPSNPSTTEPVDTGTPATLVIVAPSSLEASAPFGQRVELTWFDDATGEDGYQVDRSCEDAEADADGFCLVAELEADTESYQDNRVDSDTAYTYRVTVFGGEEEAHDTVDTQTPSILDSLVLPPPQGAWKLGSPLALADVVHISSNVDVDGLGLLLRESDRHSLPARLSGAGLDVTVGSDPALPDSGEMEVIFYQTDGPAIDIETEGRVTFEEMGEEGSVIWVAPVGAGIQMVVTANTAEGLYRGGMAAMGLFLEEDLLTPRSEIDHQIILTHPDNPVRSVYDGTQDFSLLDKAKEGLDDEALDALDVLSRAGANLVFHTGYSHYPMQQSGWRTWEQSVAEIERMEAAMADRFIEAVLEVGHTATSPWHLPSAYAFVDGLPIREEAFVLEENEDGTWLAVPENPVEQLVADHDMSDPEAWSLSSNEDCQDWTYDPEVGHAELGSWRLDADGDGGCSQLQIQLDPEKLIDGRYLLATRLLSAEDGEHLGPYGTSSGQITLVLRYDDGSTLSLNERSITLGSSVGTASPTNGNNDRSDWFELYTTFVVEGGAQGKSVEEAYLYARSSAGEGTFWLDELSLERIDGSLRNVVGGVQPPIITSRDGSRVYEEGTDYIVCQVGEDSSGVYDEICTGDDRSNYHTVYWRNMPSGTLRFGLEPRYSRDLNPFEIRWLDDGAWPDDGEVLLSFDINLTYQGQYGSGIGYEYVAQRVNFCAFDAVFEGLYWGEAYDRMMGGGVDQLAASSIRVDLSEVRGVNRSIACGAVNETDGSWETTASTGSRFADVANRLIDEARQRDPEVKVFFWDDMLNPFFNGGEVSYQQQYGGVEGASACALGSEALPALCADVTDVSPVDPDAIMIHWGYKTTGFRNAVGTAAYYDETDRPWLIGAGGEHIVAEDWASIAHGSRSNIGVSVFHFHDHDIPRGLETFWNHGWRFHAFTDFETEESSVYQIEGPALSVTSGDGEWTADGECGSWSGVTGSNWDGSSEGGLCVRSKDGLTAMLDPIEVEAGRVYRVGLHLLHTDAEPEVPRFRFSWTLADGSEEVVEWVETAEVDSLKDGFVRFETDGTGVVAPSGAVELTVELEVPAGSEALDNIMVWESVDSCFDDCSGG